MGNCTHEQLLLNVPGFYYCPQCGAGFETKPLQQQQPAPKPGQGQQ